MIRSAPACPGDEHPVVGLELVGGRDGLVAVAMTEVHVRQLGPAKELEVARVVADIQRQGERPPSHEVLHGGGPRHAQHGQRRHRAQAGGRPAVLGDDHDAVPLIERGQRLEPLLQLVRVVRRLGKEDDDPLAEDQTTEAGVLAQTVGLPAGHQAEASDEAAARRAQSGGCERKQAWQG